MPLLHGPRLVSSRFDPPECDDEYEGRNLVAERSDQQWRSKPLDMSILMIFEERAQSEVISWYILGIHYASREMGTASETALCQEVKRLRKHLRRLCAEIKRVCATLNDVALERLG